MAMEKQFTIKEVHTRSLTAVGYNPARREILIGCEDGVIKTFEAESGKLTGCTHEHRGWITDFLFWPDQKLMLSSANDGLIIAWSSGGLKSDTISLRSPVYSMTINPRRQQLVCGMNARICAYDFDPDRETGHIIDANRPAHIAREHTDIVKVVLCYESRVYSAGYDAKLIIYDSSYTGEKSMTPVHIHKKAHDAGICTLVIARDHDNTWIITGAFDKTVKIWSVDGKLVHKLEGFLNTVTGVCYAPRNKTVWVASGASSAQLFDPKSGDNISDYIGTFNNQEEEYKYSLQHLKWQNELNQVISTTSRRQVMVWKYNPSGCITSLRNKSPIESISYTRKRPILIFTGDHSGQIMKWEQMQSNTFMYSNESFVVTELMLKKMTKLRKLTDKEKLDLKNAINQMREKEREERRAKLAPTKEERKGHYGYQKSHHSTNQQFLHPNQTILVTMFVEELDIILAASEDSNIYVWGFDDSAVAVLQNMKINNSGASDGSSCASDLDKYAILLKGSASRDGIDAKSTTDYLRMLKEEESVSNRVAGFICKYILSEHRGCVTSMCVVRRCDGYDSTYVVSGGWDHRLVVWDLEQGSMQTIYKDRSIIDDINSHDPDRRTSEWAADGIITSMQYNPDQNEIAYASSDYMVYIRKFSLDGTKMPLVNTLQHDAEVTAVKWNSITKQWVTGSEDGQIKIWSGTGMNDLIMTLAEKHAVTCLCIDNVNGGIIVALQNIIKVFDSEKFRLVQTNVGHTDSVRDIIHIAERNQYISCSWDRTIRIWNEWKQPKKKVPEKGREENDKTRRARPSISVQQHEAKDHTEDDQLITK